MARGTGRAGRAPLLPEGATAFLRRRAIEVGGGLLVALAGAALLALLSYAPGDPSLNTAAPGAPANLLGRPGAALADLMLQTLGAAWLLLPVALAVWGWRIAGHRGLRRPWLRFLLLLVALLATAIGGGALAPPAAWPLPSLGGVVGLFYLADLLALGAFVGIVVPPWTLAFLAAGGGLAAFLFALGLSGEEWRALGDRARRAANAALRGGAAAARVVARLVQAARDRAEGGRARAARIEPRLDAVPAVDTDPDETAEAAKEVVGDTPPAAVDLVAPRQAPRGESSRARREREPALALEPREGYELPPLDLLAAPPKVAQERLDEDALAQNARLLESVLADFGVQGRIVKVRPGPVVAMYELEPAPGTKTSRVIGLSDDIARSMSAVSVRVAVIPGQNVIGIELPNRARETVYLRELLASKDYEKTSANLLLTLGKDIGGLPMMVDLARMPHLLVAGTTGSGKSVAINTMILSLLYRLPPETCKFIMIDPKMLELSVYDGIPHLIAPVVTEPAKAVVALKWTVREMEDRYRAMSKLGVRGIAGYNARLEEARKKGENLTRTVQTGFDSETGKPIYEEQPLDLTPLPFIVVVVDEMADLMIVAGKEIEAAIQRLAQMARAAGIHLIMATQRPSVDVITGTIKANFPTRISFQVSSRVDSRTILGETGAEQLLGQGDMLYMAGGGRLTRVHGPLVTDAEVDQVVRFISGQGAPTYIEEVTEEPEAALPGMAGDGEYDPLYDQAVALVCRERKASTSFVQRHLQIGYNRAARIVDQMESEGVIGPANHVGKREVLAPDHSD